MLSLSDMILIMVSVCGIALAIWLIARVGIHPFAGLLCAALVIGLGSGMPAHDAVKAVEKGFGDILGGTGIVVSLGLSLGMILQMSGAAQTLASRALALTGERYASWGALGAAMVLGLPLFFETGVVLLLPIIAAGLLSSQGDRSLRFRVMLSALAGLSVLHALLPPHPGPLIAVKELGAPLGRTMIYGFLAAVPTAIIAGPLLARLTVSESLASTGPSWTHATTVQAKPISALICLLFPVLLIASGAFVRLEGGESSGDEFGRAVAVLADPVVALLLGNVAALLLLFGRRTFDSKLQEEIWGAALLPAAGILLSIGAGGSLKQVLVSAGLSDIFTRLATLSILSPTVIAWLVAALIRVATGSATVATITAAGIMGPLAHQNMVDPTFLVLAIGAGSVFLSHVNDPGFWLVKGYLGTTTAGTFRLWSTLESAIAVVGLAAVLLLQWASSALFPAGI